MWLKRAFLSLGFALYVAIAVGAEIAINDGGTWRLPQQIEINDAGTWRNIQEVYVNDGGTWRTVFRRAEAFTFTAGTCTFFATPISYGYEDGSDPGTGASCGSVTAGTTTFSDGRIVAKLITDLSGGTPEFIVIRGFGSDPGSSYLTSLSVGGTSVTIGTYSYSSGRAQWGFSGISDLVDGNSYAVEIVHQ